MASRDFKLYTGMEGKKKFDDALGDYFVFMEAQGLAPRYGDHDYAGDVSWLSIKKEIKTIRSFINSYSYDE